MPIVLVLPEHGLVFGNVTVHEGAVQVQGYLGHSQLGLLLA